MSSQKYIAESKNPQPVANSATANEPNPLMRNEDEKNSPDLQEVSSNESVYSQEFPPTPPSFPLPLSQPRNPRRDNQDEKVSPCNSVQSSNQSYQGAPASGNVIYDATTLNPIKLFKKEIALIEGKYREALNQHEQQVKAKDKLHALSLQNKIPPSCKWTFDINFPKGKALTVRDRIRDHIKNAETELRDLLTEGRKVCCEEISEDIDTDKFLNTHFTAIIKPLIEGLPIDVFNHLVGALDQHLWNSLNNIKHKRSINTVRKNIERHEKEKKREQNREDLLNNIQPTVSEYVEETLVRHGLISDEDEKRFSRPKSRKPVKPDKKVNPGKFRNGGNDGKSGIPSGTPKKNIPRTDPGDVGDPLPPTQKYPPNAEPPNSPPANPPSNTPHRGRGNNRSRGRGRGRSQGRGRGRNGKHQPTSSSTGNNNSKGHKRRNKGRYKGRGRGRGRGRK